VRFREDGVEAGAQRRQHLGLAQLQIQLGVGLADHVVVRVVVRGAELPAVLLAHRDHRIAVLAVAGQVGQRHEAGVADRLRPVVGRCLLGLASCQSATRSMAPSTAWGLMAAEGAAWAAAGVSAAAAWTGTACSMTARAARTAVRRCDGFMWASLLYFWKKGCGVWCVFTCTSGRP
jgi:hypothetical protein